MTAILMTFSGLAPLAPAEIFYDALRMALAGLLVAGILALVFWFNDRRARRKDAP